MSDIGDVESIRSWAKASDSNVTQLKLESQFRCNGSDGYLAWVDNTLGIRPTANTTLDGIPYDFRVCASATEPRNLIRERNLRSNKARMVAGYCWKWESKRHPEEMNIMLPKENFSAQWNFSDAGSPGILQPDSVEQVGCIHTCQGLEVEYIGVIFGPDRVIRNGQWVDSPRKRASTDASIKGYLKLHRSDPAAADRKANEIIRNTYRTLMTRGQKGCYIYSVDPTTNEHLKEVAGTVVGYGDSLTRVPPQTTRSTGLPPTS